MQKAPPAGLFYENILTKTLVVETIEVRVKNHFPVHLAMHLFHTRFVETYANTHKI